MQQNYTELILYKNQCPIHNKKTRTGIQNVSNRRQAMNSIQKTKQAVGLLLELKVEIL